MVSQTLTVNMENRNNHHKTSLYIQYGSKLHNNYYHVWELCTKQIFFFYNVEGYLQHTLKKI